ncbi:MAG: TlpA disulfide reductase family protein [Vicinamibacterales bacterium]
MRCHLSLLLLGAVLVPSLAGAQAPAPAAPPAAPVGVIAETRAAIAEKDFAKGEKIVLGHLASEGTTAEAIEAWSWLGRGALAAKMYREADAYAMRTYKMVDEALLTRKLDDETHLPLALGASIEVQGQVLAAEGARSDAVIFLRKELQRYKDTSIAQRIIKNVNLLSLEGQPAFELNRDESLGSQRTALGELKGKPVLLFLWAHWCPDCKVMGPYLEAMAAKYRSSGFTIVAPTQRYGYVARRKPAGPDEELEYIKAIRDQFYPWLKDAAVPLSPANFLAYGVSTTPTLVFVDRSGNVANYHPGQMTAEELEAAIKAITASSSAAPAPRQD